MIKVVCIKKANSLSLKIIEYHIKPSCRNKWLEETETEEKHSVVREIEYIFFNKKCKAKKKINKIKWKFKEKRTWVEWSSQRNWSWKKPPFIHI